MIRENGKPVHPVQQKAPIRDQTPFVWGLFREAHSIARPIPFRAEWFDPRTGNFTGMRNDYEVMNTRELLSSLDPQGRRILAFPSRYGVVIAFDLYPPSDPRRQLVYNAFLNDKGAKKNDTDDSGVFFVHKRWLVDVFVDLKAFVYGPQFADKGNLTDHQPHPPYDKLEDELAKRVVNPQPTRPCPPPPVGATEAPPPASAEKKVNMNENQTTTEAIVEQPKKGLWIRIKEATKAFFSLETLRTALRLLALVIFGLILALPAIALGAAVAAFFGINAGVLAVVAGSFLTHMAVAAFRKEATTLLEWMSGKADQFADWLGRVKTESETQPVTGEAPAAA